MQVEVPPELGTAELDQIASLYGRGAIVVNARAEIAGLSEFARLALASNRWPIQVHASTLRIIDRVQHSKFLEQLRQVGNREQIVGGVMLPKVGAVLPVLLTVTHLGQGDLMLITVRDPSWVGKEDRWLLQQVFGFTRREAELASHLAGGGVLSDFTAKHHLTINTVKSHLRHAFRKAGVRSQAQLVVVVLAVLR